MKPEKLREPQFWAALLTTLGTVCVGIAMVLRFTPQAVLLLAVTLGATLLQWVIYFGRLGRVDTE